MNFNSERLTARVQMRNHVNETKNRIAPIMLAYLQAFLGKKVIVGAGELSSKIKLPELGLVNCSLYFDQARSKYSLAWNIRASIEVQERTLYLEDCIYLGSIKDCVLTSLVNYEPLPTDYTVEKVAAVFTEIENAKQVLREAKDKLWPFSEEDTY